MIERIKATDLAVTDTKLAFELENRAAIDAHWTEQLIARPRSWNGPFFLFENVRLNDGVLCGLARRTDFATFLYLRHKHRVDHVLHITGGSFPVTADGVILAMRMASHTVNAGRVYFPAGSFDPADIIDGQLDALFNVRREVAEETGMKFSENDFAAPLGVFVDHTWHVAYPVRIPYDFDTCCSMLRVHQIASGDDELDGYVAIRNADDAEQLLPFARALSLHYFQNPNEVLPNV